MEATKSERLEHRVDLTGFQRLKDIVADSIKTISKHVTRALHFMRGFCVPQTICF